MHALTHMGWPSRLAWGLLAWPVMVLLAILLSNAADPRAVNQPWLVALVGLGEVIAAAWRSCSLSGRSSRGPSRARNRARDTRESTTAPAHLPRHDPLTETSGKPGQAPGG
jgi:hypothetical protein